MIAIQEYGFSSRECEDFEVVVWKKALQKAKEFVLRQR
jgi:hypothetical protein